LSDSGRIQLSGGKLSAASLSVLTGGLLTGSGTIAPAVANSGSISITAGTLDFIGGLTNNATITASGGTLFANSAVSGTGAIQLLKKGLANFGTTVASTDTVQFKDATGVIDLPDPTDFHGTISGMAAGDIIDLINITVSGHSYNSGTLTVVSSVGTFGLHIPGSFTSTSFNFNSDNHGGTNITVT
jgi:hypothetical protein